MTIAAGGLAHSKGDCDHTVVLVSHVFVEKLWLYPAVLLGNDDNNDDDSV